MCKRVLMIAALCLVLAVSIVPRFAFAQGWEADDSSIYTQIRSTISHYLFNDDFSNVPFGSGWVDLICTILTCMVFVLPFFVLLIAFRWICRL